MAGQGLALGRSGVCRARRRAGRATLAAALTVPLLGEASTGRAVCIQAASQFRERAVASFCFELLPSERTLWPW